MHSHFAGLLNSASSVALFAREFLLQENVTVTLRRPQSPAQDRTARADLSLSSPFSGSFQCARDVSQLTNSVRQQQLIGFSSPVSIPSLPIDNKLRFCLSAPGLSLRWKIIIFSLNIA
jgi:hypothetical protein